MNPSSSLALRTGALEMTHSQTLNLDQKKIPLTFFAQILTQIDIYVEVGK